MFIQQQKHRVRRIMLLNAISHFMSDDTLCIHANAMQILLPGTVENAIYRSFFKLNLFIASSILLCSGMHILKYRVVTSIDCLSRMFQIEAL